MIGDPEDAANSTKLTVDDDNGLVTVTPSLAVDTSVQHAGDANTKMQFATDTIDFDAGGREGMKLTSTETQFNNGITVTGAAQFNGGISVTGGGLTFSTSAQFEDGITVTGNAQFNGGINVTGGAVITFLDNQGFATTQRAAAQNGFRYQAISSGSGLSTLATGLIDIDNSGEVDKVQFYNVDKEGNDLGPLLTKLKDNGGYFEISSGDFSQAIAIAIESQAGDDATVSSGETTIAVGSTISTVQGEFDIEQGLDTTNTQEVFVKIIPNAANFIRDFNGVTGSVITSALTIPVTGLSAGSSGIISEGGITVTGAAQFNGGISITGGGLTFSTHVNAALGATFAGNIQLSGSESQIEFGNGEVIRNNPDGSIQIIPSDESGNHFGVEIDATEWGFGPVINVIDESGTQVTKAIRLDTDITFSDTNVPDGSPARLMFNNGSNRGFQENPNGDGTVMFGVNDNNGHFAIGRKADLSDGDRSMSTDDKTALGMSDPQFLVYSADATDADDYIRLEHDQTDANIYSGNGGINLVPLSGAVGISGGGLNVGTNGITFGDDTTQKTATKDVGTFTISASSAISTGAKADALHRIPYNATLTKFELKSKATGGMTAAIYIAGADFGNPTNAFITGATAETTGFTADTTTFGTATVNEGDFVYLHVLANASGATAAQAFVSYETRA